MEVKEKLAKLREGMSASGIDLYLIPTADFHESEYAGEHFGVRKYMSGFTGSAGTLLVGKEKAALWADGRYFIQAERELAGSTIELMRMGEENVPTIEKYIEDNIPENGVLGFDGRVINSALGNKLKKAIAKKNADIKYDKDLVDEFWTDRPALSVKPAFFLEEKYSGRPVSDKLAFVRKTMKDEGADAFVLTSLDDIAWLYNMRGDDIPCNPVVLSYTVVFMDKAVLFLNEAVLNDKLRAEFEANNVEIKPYNDIYEYVKGLKECKKVMLDGKKVNYAIYSNIPENVEKLDKTNPTTLEKAKKNSTEIENIKKVHVKDGIAMVKFIYWVKKNVGKMKITEISASDYLEARRREQEGFIELSFDTIAAYNANAAMMHYSATPEHDAELKPEGFFLVDSGGQYYEGTTDITRTIVLGPVKYEWKRDYTLTLKGHMNLLNAKFLYGCTGINLDILCRAPLWNIGIDYKCGTGHGVGYLLNVHEAPNGFRWKMVPERNDSAVLEEGMITTDEPGVYAENSHGIRIENELLCKKDIKNEYGQFMCFESVTYAPIDKEAIDVNYLEKKDIEQIDAYHRLVFEKLSPHFEGEELAWLKEACEPIKED